MTEAELLAQVLRMCTGRNLHAYHNPQTKRATLRGFPDLVIWGPMGLIFRELKSDYGRRSRAQVALLRSLISAREDAGTWRPGDLASGRIECELDALAWR